MLCKRNIVGLSTILDQIFLAHQFHPQLCDAAPTLLYFPRILFQSLSFSPSLGDLSIPCNICKRCVRILWCVDVIKPQEASIWCGAAANNTQFATRGAQFELGLSLGNDSDDDGETMSVKRPQATHIVATTEEAPGSSTGWLPRRFVCHVGSCGAAVRG